MHSTAFDKPQTTILSDKTDMNPTADHMSTTKPSAQRHPVSLGRKAAETLRGSSLGTTNLLSTLKNC